MDGKSADMLHILRRRYTVCRPSMQPGTKLPEASPPATGQTAAQSRCDEQMLDGEKTS